MEESPLIETFLCLHGCRNGAIIELGFLRAWFWRPASCSEAEVILSWIIFPQQFAPYLLISSSIMGGNLCISVDRSRSFLVGLFWAECFFLGSSRLEPCLNLEERCLSEIDLGRVDVSRLGAWLDRVIWQDSWSWSYISMDDKTRLSGTWPC